jgi:hypothetical protein
MIFLIHKFCSFVAISLKCFIIYAIPVSVPSVVKKVLFLFFSANPAVKNRFFYLFLFFLLCFLCISFMAKKTTRGAVASGCRLRDYSSN